MRLPYRFSREAIMWQLLKAEFIYNRFGLLLSLGLVSLCFFLVSGYLLQESDKDRSDIQTIDANYIRMAVESNGSFAHARTNGPKGLEYPRGPLAGRLVTASGLWITGKVDGEIRTTVSGHTSEYVAGTAEGEHPDLRDRVLKITSARTPEEARDRKDWPVDRGAPAEKDGDPRVLGDQTLWTVYNDMDSSYHKEKSGHSDPLGIEVRQTTFAFARKGPLGHMVFLDFMLVNQGEDSIRDTYISLWCDADLGYHEDDLLGCDTSLGLGYCYNADEFDPDLGSDPPAVGMILLKGATMDDGSSPGMTSFSGFESGSDPESPEQAYAYMRGLNRMGKPVLDPQTGLNCEFHYPGDPVSNTGWIDTKPADKRFLINSGPYTFAPGDTQRVVAAFVAGAGSDRHSSLSRVKSHSRIAWETYHRNFDLPEAESAEMLDGIEDDWYPAQTVPFLVFIMILAMVMVAIVNNTRFRERRERLVTTLPLPIQEIATARLLSFILPVLLTFVVIWILSIFSGSYFVLISKVLLTGFGLVVCVLSPILIVNDLFSNFLRKKELIIFIGLGLSFLGALFLGLFAIGADRDDFAFQLMEGIFSVLEQVLIFIFTTGGALALLAFGLFLAWITILTYRSRKSYIE